LVSDLKVIKWCYSYLELKYVEIPVLTEAGKGKIGVLLKMIGRGGNYDRYS